MHGRKALILMRIDQLRADLSRLLVKGKPVPQEIRDADKALRQIKKLIELGAYDSEIANG